MSDIYDVLPISTHLGTIRDKEENIVKPYVAIYFPDEILQKLKWTRETRLKLSIEKGYLKIEKSDSDEPLYFDFNDLTYEMDEDN